MNWFHWVEIILPTPPERKRKRHLPWDGESKPPSSNLSLRPSRKSVRDLTSRRLWSVPSANIAPAVQAQTNTDWQRRAKTGTDRHRWTLIANKMFHQIYFGALQCCGAVWCGDAWRGVTLALSVRKRGAFEGRWLGDRNAPGRRSSSSEECVPRWEMPC